MTTCPAPVFSFSVYRSHVDVRFRGHRLGALPVALFDRLLAWQERATQRRRLAALDDRMLADIGVTRGDAAAEADKPFWRP